MYEMKPTDYDGYYATSDGRIWSAKSNIFLSPSCDSHGYCRVNLWVNGEQFWQLVHRLVAKAFIDNPNNFKEVNHKDENPSNNAVDNLEWVDRQMNCDWGTRNQRISETLKKVSKKRGEHAEAVPVYMCDKETHEIIQFFDSIKSACDFLQKPQGGGNVSKVLNGKRQTAYKYFWKKAEKIVDK